MKRQPQEVLVLILPLVLESRFIHLDHAKKCSIQNGVLH